MINPTQNSYVIIGHSAASLTAAQAIRSNDASGDITIIAAEDNLAYSPVLLTYYISGKIGRNDLFLTDTAFYRKNNIKLLQGKRAEKLDTENRMVNLEDGTSVRYDKLLIATGSSPKKLNISDETLPGIFTLKTLADADNILSHSASKKDVAILGGGLIGLQAANALARSGKNITVVIGSSQVMSQNIDQDCSAIISKFIQESGFTVLYNNSVTKISEKQNRLLLALNNGEEIMTDTIIAGKGVSPNIQLTKDSGINTNYGIPVNDAMQTNISNVFAAGDVAEGDNLATGKQQIIATWPNACQQGKTAGANMTGSNISFKGLNGNICSFLDKAIASVGITKIDSENYFETTHTEPGSGVYRKLVFNNNDEIVGAVFLEAVSDIGIVRNMVNKKIKVPASQRKQLARSPISYSTFYHKLMKS
ncbi:MAG: FAD-dependent oxidoreductase [Desulfobacterales bacterium]|nr:FAD-dependent oxidoreductase [Desulfobacterales bacterium]